MSREHEALNQFGQLLIERVRDAAIRQWEGVLAGRMQSERAQRCRERFASLTPAERQAVSRLIADVVDTTLHHLLWTLEQESETVQLSMHTQAGTVMSLAEHSDSFPAELYDIDGWIARFSKEPYFDPASG